MTGFWFLPARPLRLNTNEWWIHTHTHTHIRNRRNSCMPCRGITDVHVADILHVYTRDILMNVDVFTAAGRTDTGRTGEMMTNSTRNAVFFVNRYYL